METIQAENQNSNEDSNEELLNDLNANMLRRVITNCDQLPLFIKKLREFHKSVQTAEKFNKKNVQSLFKIGDKVEITEGLHEGSSGVITGVNRIRCFIDLGLKKPFYVKIASLKLCQETADDVIEIDIDSDLEDKFEKEITKDMLPECEQDIDDNDHDDEVFENSDLEDKLETALNNS